MATQHQTLLPVREIAAAAQALIDLLDVLGGDPDLEDGTDAEDEGLTADALMHSGAGCAISDPGGGNVEDAGDRCSANEDLGTHSYITDEQRRTVKQIGRRARQSTRIRVNPIVRSSH